MVSKEKTGRLLGIDYGGKRVGVAVSDESQTIAVPLAVLPNDRTLFREIKEICNTRAVEGIVMGDSKDFRGNDNPIMKAANAFKAELERDLHLPVYLEPEFLTSHQAAKSYGSGADGNLENESRSRAGGSASMNPLLDASAAAIILQSFLDRKNSSRRDLRSKEKLP